MWNLEEIVFEVNSARAGLTVLIQGVYLLKEAVVFKVP